MKNTKRSILCLSVLSALILTGCNKSGKDLAPAGWDDGVVWTSAGETEYNKLSDLKRGSTYRAYETYLPSSFNTAVTMQQADGQIITNLVDGLVDVNRYGRIIPDLAESWTTNEVNLFSKFVMELFGQETMATHTQSMEKQFMLRLKTGSKHSRKTLHMLTDPILRTYQ